MRRILKTTEIKDLREELTPPDGLCPILKVPMEGSAKIPVLDHCHDSGMIRGVISLNANSVLGRIEKAYRKWLSKHTELSLPEVLRLYADYLEQPEHEIEHPEHINKHKRKVRRWKDSTLENKIKAKGVEVPEKISRRKLVELYVNVCVIGD